MASPLVFLLHFPSPFLGVSFSMGRRTQAMDALYLLLVSVDLPSSSLYVVKMLRSIALLFGSYANGEESLFSILHLFFRGMATPLLPVRLGS